MQRRIIDVSCVLASLFGIEPALAPDITRKSGYVPASARSHPSYMVVPGTVPGTAHARVLAAAGTKAARQAHASGPRMRVSESERVTRDEPVRLSAATVGHYQPSDACTERLPPAYTASIRTLPSSVQVHSCWTAARTQSKS